MIFQILQNNKAKYLQKYRDSVKLYIFPAYYTYNKYDNAYNNHIALCPMDTNFAVNFIFSIIALAECNLRSCIAVMSVNMGAFGGGCLYISRKLYHLPLSLCLSFKLLVFLTECSLVILNKRDTSKRVMGQRIVFAWISRHWQF